MIEDEDNIGEQIGDKETWMMLGLFVIYILLLLALCFIVKSII